MPKMKTHSGAKKRFSKTKTGRIKRGHQGMRHILSKKSPGTKRKLRKIGYIAECDMSNIKYLLPY